MSDFIGVKIALITDDSVITIQRDNKPGLRYAGMWDLPGGGNEGNESPAECAIREVREELGIDVLPISILLSKQYPALHDDSLIAYFMVAKVAQSDIDAIQFGNEGQGWRLMPFSEFMDRTDVIEPLKERLKFYLDTRDL
jgi:8-oxo-dGTP diphosphatase